jgi:hypothetical protein
VNIRSAGKGIGATAGLQRLPMARAPPIFPHAETSACPAVGQLGNRLDDLFGQRARIFCRYLLITVETGLAGAGSRRTSRYFHLPPDGTHEGGGRTTRQTRHRFALRGPEKRRGCSAATPHRDNLVASALAGALQNAVYQALAEASVASGTASAACSAGTRVGVCLLTGHRVGPACQYVRYRSHQAFCHQPGCSHLIAIVNTQPLETNQSFRSSRTIDLIEQKLAAP